MNGNVNSRLRECDQLCSAARVWHDLPSVLGEDVCRSQWLFRISKVLIQGENDECPEARYEKADDLAMLELQYGHSAMERLPLGCLTE